MIYVAITVQGRLVADQPLTRPMEIGRQQMGEPDPVTMVPGEADDRWIVAPLQEISIGRRQLRIEPLANDRLRLTNLNRTLSIAVDRATALVPGETREESLPIVLTLGSLSIRMFDRRDRGTFQSLSHQTLPPGRMTLASRGDQPSLAAFLGPHDSDGILARLEQLISTLQFVATSPTFAQEVAAATRELVGLDHAAMLLYDGREWQMSAVSSRRDLGAGPWGPSRTLLDRVLADRRTFWQGASDLLAISALSVRGITAAVAAPILDASGRVCGAIYGDRDVTGAGAERAIGKIDAQLVELLASGVAGGLSRLEHERASMARRIQFERFVTPEVARQLDEDSEALDVRDAEVTLIFCDISGFSAISERLSTQQTFAWINDVMESLSACVLENGGTLVDYIGDELIAMWGAPYPQEQHALAACRAAMAMLDRLESINTRWSSELGATTGIGIGINSGLVGVGNTGSQVKLKYGPLGSQVNIASRVQGITRHLRTPVLLTEATALLLADSIPLRRVGAVQVKNIEQPLNLYELVVGSLRDSGDEDRLFAQGLECWESHDLNGAIRHLSQLVAVRPDDGPGLVLLSRAIEAWSRHDDDYDIVWRFSSK